MKKRTLIYYFFWLLIPLPVFAQQYKNEFGIKSDNDSYLATGQDRYYTNGIAISFRHAVDQFRLKAGTVKKTWGVEIGQKMYNAKSGYVDEIGDVDRPFAAYLYVGGRLNWFYKNGQVLRTSVQIGIIGPNALGKETQSFLHDNFGFYAIRGWQYQVANSFEVNSAVDYTELLIRMKNDKIDLSATGYVNVGTTFSGVGGGFLVRSGAINSFSNSASFNSRISSYFNGSPKKEFFFFARPMLHVVAYDATVQGGLFVADKGPVTYRPRPIVFSQDAGVVFADDKWTFTFTLTVKTKEIKSPAKPHQYGSIGISYRFN